MFGRLRKPAMTDGVIDLYVARLGWPDEALGFDDVYDYYICPHGTRKEAGQISFRTGESDCVYYFGHIGYHIDPPWRGQHWAARACMLLKPLIEVCGKQSVVITNDPDNIGSRRTCERIGCELESIVEVPREMQRRWGLSPVKCRYIWRMDQRLEL